jgi:O-antigen ligase
MSIKKPLIFLSTALIPFLIVWISFICTGFSFNPREVFRESTFWAISTFYWLVWLMMSPLIAEAINEIFSSSFKNQLK